MGSTRLEGKILKYIKDNTVLSHVINRVKLSEYIDEIIIATTNLDRDLVIENEAIKNDVLVFKGSEDDVLSRYYYAAKQYKLDIIVRVTSDCPLIDSKIIDDVVKVYMDREFDIITNTGSDFTKSTYPNGLDVEVFSFESLEDAFLNAKENYQREHVTPYIYENSKKIYFYKSDIDYSKYRLTLDTHEDFELICAIYDRLYKGKHDFYLKEIIELFVIEPELHNINSFIKQKKIK